MKATMDRSHIQSQLAAINRLNAKDETIIRFMEVCGTHTHAIGKSGIRQLLPDNIQLISGPGCPVCVTHEQEIEAFLSLAARENVVIATFGDMLRVPCSRGSLDEARGEGARVKVVYSPLEALSLAERNKHLEIVFLGVGFETTAPLVAASMIKAQKNGLKNFSVYSLHKVIPPALEVLLLDEQVQLNGFILPGHVSTIIGEKPYQFIAERFNKGGVIAGFAPHDILEAIIMLLKQRNDVKPEITIQYNRGMNADGNPAARQVLEQVFVIDDAWWRGLGMLKNSGLRIREELQELDAAKKFGIVVKDCTEEVPDNGCACGEILKGIKLPGDCALFGKKCTPSYPIGPCMVSSEGTCAAYYRYSQYC